MTQLNWNDYWMNLGVGNRRHSAKAEVILNPTNIFVIIVGFFSALFEKVISQNEHIQPVTHINIFTYFINLQDRLLTYSHLAPLFF